MDFDSNTYYDCDDVLHTRGSDSFTLNYTTLRKMKLNTLIIVDIANCGIVNYRICPWAM